VDLNDIAGLERAWSELERVRAIRAIDPPLREAILRHVDRLEPAVAEPIRIALDQAHPEVVLAAYFTDIVPNRPTIGAFMRARAAAGEGAP